MFHDPLAALTANEQLRGRHTRQCSSISLVITQVWPIWKIVFSCPTKLRWFMVPDQCNKSVREQQTLCITLRSVIIHHVICCAELNGSLPKVLNDAKEIFLCHRRGWSTACLQGQVFSMRRQLDGASSGGQGGARQGGKGGGWDGHHTGVNPAPSHTHLRSCPLMPPSGLPGARLHAHCFDIFQLQSVVSTL